MQMKISWIVLTTLFMLSMRVSGYSVNKFPSVFVPHPCNQGFRGGLRFRSMNSVGAGLGVAGFAGNPPMLGFTGGLGMLGFPKGYHMSGSFGGDTSVGGGLTMPGFPKGVHQTGVLGFGSSMFGNQGLTSMPCLIGRKRFLKRVKKHL